MRVNLDFQLILAEICCYNTPLNCIKQYNERIRQMTGKLKHLECYKDTNSFKLDMKRFEIELDNDKHYKTELFNKANALLREEEEKSESLIKANEKLFPSIPKFT